MVSLSAVGTWAFMGWLIGGIMFVLHRFIKEEGDTDA